MKGKWNMKNKKGYLKIHMYSSGYQEQENFFNADN
jgi:hypothetical protein